MAHFAKIGLNSKVISVHSVYDKDCQDAEGVEDEEVGRQFLEKIHNYPLWVQTSYNTRDGVHKNGKTPLRGNHAGMGMTYDEENDIFIDPKPFPSWVLNTTDVQWHSPIGDAPSLTEQETLKYSYQWNETDQSWDKIDMKPDLVL